MNDAPCTERTVFESEFGKFWISRIVGHFEVSTFANMPFGTFTVRVIDRGNGEFMVTPNVQVFNSSTKCIEHICGLGQTAQAAVEDAIKFFMLEVRKQQENKPGQELDESDFVWLNWQPYVQLWMPPTGQ